MALFRRPKDPHELLAKGKYKDAVEGFKGMLAQEPKNENLHVKLGDALLASGDMKGCLASYARAAEIYAEKGFLIKAVALEKKILKIDPSQEDSLRYVAKLAQEDAPPPPRLSQGAPAPPPTKEPQPPKVGPAASAPPPPRDDAANLALDDALTETAPEKKTAGAPLPGLDDKPKKDIPCSRARVPLFSDLKPVEFASFVKELRHHTLPKGVTIVREGAAGDSMYVISEGAVRVLTKDRNGEEVHLTDLHEGDFFGEVSLLKGVRRTATIVTATDTELLELTKTDLDHFAKTYPGILKVMENFYASRVQHTIETLREREKRGG